MLFSFMEMLTSFSSLSLSLSLITKMNPVWRGDSEDEVEEEEEENMIRRILYI